MLQHNFSQHERGTIFSMELSTEEIYRHIQGNLSIRTIEKNKYGEVFTPIKYINELLDQLPSSVWSNSKLRWLEPACGIGHFCAVIYWRLISGLENEIADRGERHDYIIKNMLFMVEINPLNVERTIDLFGKDSNIICADFLSLSALSSFKQNIDIIIGNPPFQTPHDDTRKSGFGGQILWDKFIVQSIDILHKGNVDYDRFLCFITPPSWRKPNSNLWSVMTSKVYGNCLRYLHILNKKTAIEDLQVQQRMDVFVLECVNTNTNTIHTSIDNNTRCQCIIKTGYGEDIVEYNNINPRDWPFLPNASFDLIKRILDPSSTPKQCRVIYDRMAYGSDTKHMSKTKTSENIYPVVHTMTKRGLGIWYSNTNNNGHFGVPKVILNFNEILYPYLDSSGEYGMGQFSFGLPISCKKHGDDIIQALNSNRFREIIKSTKWAAYQTDRRMFEYFKDDFYNSFIGS